MKRLLYILFAGCFLLLLAQESKSVRAVPVPDSPESLYADDSSGERQQAEFRLSGEIQRITCLASRPFQVVHPFAAQRFSKNLLRQFHELRIKEYNVQRKLSEDRSIVYISDYSSLLTCRGYRIFALCKLLI